MDVMITKLSEIETAASSIVENARQKKEDIFKEADEKKKIIDEESEKEIEQRIADLIKEMEEKKERDVAALRLSTQQSIQRISEIYEKHHKEIAEEIVGRMIEAVR